MPLDLARGASSRSVRQLGRNFNVRRRMIRAVPELPRWFRGQAHRDGLDRPARVSRPPPTGLVRRG